MHRGSLFAWVSKTEDADRLSNPQGVSYTLSTLTVPTLLTLPSASTAAKAFRSLDSTAKTQLRVLSSVSGSAFLLAFLLSSRPYRHPYLLYTSVLVFSSRFVTSEILAPYLFPSPRDGPGSTSKQQTQVRRERASRAGMEASYEVLGSDSHSDGAASEDLEPDEDAQAQQINGEVVRGEVEEFLKKQVLQTAVAGLGFLMAVIGIWGDGAVQVYQSETFVIDV